MVNVTSGLAECDMSWPSIDLMTNGLYSKAVPSVMPDPP
jgi:hypothetical protein